MAGIVLLFVGMEVNAVHINDLENPTSQYPKAILLSVVIIVAIFSLGAASLALILPKDDISLTAGIMQAFHFVLAQYNLLWLVKILGAFIAFGVVAAIIAWICGPSRGLLVAAENGEIPQFLAYKNKNDVQSNILIMQGIMVTVLASLHLLIKNIDEVYFLLTVMAVTLYLLMYFLMFISALKLRYTMPDIQRKYKVPGGIAGIWLVCVVGILSVVFALVCGFFPPEQLGIGSPELYLGIIITGVVVFVLIPIFMTSPKKPYLIKLLNLFNGGNMIQKKIEGHITFEENDYLQPVYASRSMAKAVPKYRLPDTGMSPDEAYTLIHDQLILDGNVKLNLATFVTTWMEPQARKLVSETLDKNLIDKDEYPQTAKIEEYYIKMITKLWNTPNISNIIGCSTVGSSEACMLAGLAMKRNWQRSMKIKGKKTDKPNLIIGINAQVCWKKFCNYWEIEMRTVKLKKGRYILSPEEVIKLCDENTIGIIGILGSTLTGEYEDIEKLDRLVDEHNRKQGIIFLSMWMQQVVVL